MEGHTRMESGDNLTDGRAPVESTTEVPSIPKMISCETTQSDTIPDQRSPTGDQFAQNDEPNTDQNMGNAELSTEQAIASPVPDSQEVEKTDDLVGLSAETVPATASEAERETNEDDRPCLDSSSLEPVVETAETKANDHDLAVDQSSDTAGPPDAEMGKENNDIDSVAVGSISTEEQPKQAADIHVSGEPMVIPVLPDAEMKDVNNGNIDPVDSVVAGSILLEERPEQTTAVHVSAEPMVIPIPRDAEMKDVYDPNSVDSIVAGSVSTEEHSKQTVDLEPTTERYQLINGLTEEKLDTVESVVASAAITTCNVRQTDNSVKPNLLPPVTNIQTELGKESSSAVSINIDEPNDKTAIAGIESGSPAPGPSMPTVEPISCAEVGHIPHTISSEEPTNCFQVQSGADSSKKLTNFTNVENTELDSGCMIGTMTQIKSEKSRDSERTPQIEEFGETAIGDYSGSNEIELSEYQWSNDQSFRWQANVSQDYETDGDPSAERSWQGQAMLEVVGYESGDPLYSAGTEGEVPNLNFCIDSIRGDVPWPPSGGEDEGDDAAGTSKQVVDSHRIKFKTRGRGRGGVDLLALPYLRQKNRAGTADGYYSLNSNVKGLIAWLNHSKGPYTMTITLFGFKVVEEPLDATETSFTCELCKMNYTDVETFLGHCRETQHIANKATAVQRSLKLYNRQIIARTQAKKVQDGGGVVNTISTEGASNIGLAPNIYEQDVYRGGYRGGRRARGRGRPLNHKYERRLQFTQKRRLQQPPNSLLPKRGRGRPRKIQPGPSVGRMTEGNQPLLNTLPFDKTKPSVEEDKRILRVKPLPRQEDRRTRSGDIDSTECAMDEEACDSDGPPPPTVPDTVVHGTSLSGISSPKRALFDQSETSPGHSAEPRRKRHRYSTETPQESDASSTSASVRSHRRSSWEPMDSPRYEDHTPPKTSPGEVLKRGRGRPLKKIHHSGMTPKSTPASSPVAQTSNSLGIPSGISPAKALPLPIVKLERTMPEKLLDTRKERVQPGPSSTITSASSFGNEELLDSLTDEQLWAELLERKTVHSCTCGFAFSTSSAYYLHKACHNTVNEKTCSFCGLEATNWMMFHAHFFNHKAPT